VFNYLDASTKLHLQTWAASTAHSLYLSLQKAVLDDINVRDLYFQVSTKVYIDNEHLSCNQDANSKISLVSDVWTTKGGHKAFLGISACYITKNWVYRCQHLSIKYISWHHKGQYLAAPFARVLIKNGLHKKISIPLLSNTFFPSKLTLLAVF
jgi:hypothetical protein